MTVSDVAKSHRDLCLLSSFIGQLREFEFLVSLLVPLTSVGCRSTMFFNPHNARLGREPSLPRFHRTTGAKSMKRFLCALSLGLVLVGLVQSQNRQPSGMPVPRLYVVTPAGAKAGSTVEITVGGFNIEDATQMVFSDPRLKAQLVAEPTEPPPVDPKTKKTNPAMGKPKATPSSVKFKVTIPGDISLGNHDLRVVTAWGVSNPRAFHIGDLNETNEVEPNNDIETSPNKPQRVELNTTVNATLNQPNDVDYYVFKAAKGQRVIVSVLSTSIDSRAQPAVEIYDAKNRQLGENLFYSVDDALLDVTAPEEGDYFIRIYQFTHTFRTALTGGLPPGTSDNQYRLSVSTAPWIDAVVPNVIQPGQTATVTIWGRNLPGGKLDPTAKLDNLILEKTTATITAPADGTGRLRFSGVVMPSGGLVDGFEYRTKNASGSSNPYLIGLARHPVVTEKGDNDTPEKAQPVTLPCEIAGVIEKRNDSDWYKFTAKKGETWNIQVISQRLGAPTFMTFALRNPKTKAEIYEAPLEPNTMAGYSRRFFRRTEDPYGYRFIVPEDGEYELMITSRAAGTMFGPRHTYAVRISKDDPDFRLVALGEEEYVPSAAVVPVGGSQAFNVIVEREGEFGGDIQLTVEGLPPGVTCPPQTLGGGVKETSLVISAAPGTAEWVGTVKIIGSAIIGGKKVTQEARAASIVWPVAPNGNTPTVTRIDRDIILAVKGKPIFVITPTIDKADLVQGDKATCKVKLDRPYAEAKGPVQVGVIQTQTRQGSELPVNLKFGGNNQPIAINAGQADGTFAVTVAADVPPGKYNVVFRASSQVPFSKDPMAKTKPPVTAIAISSPLTVNVLPKSLATLQVANATNAKIGQKTEVVVRVTRLYKFEGEFKVELVLPPGVAGISAATVTIPSGETEAKLMFDVPASAAPGARNNLTVKATAMWDGKVPTVHEQKINVNVVK